MSRVLPILFNTEMVRAIIRLISHKTATRRIVKGFIPEDAIWGYSALTPKGCISCRGIFENLYGEKFFKLPYQPGDILYVRETWRVGAWDIRNQMIAFDYKDGTCGQLTYINDRELFERLVNQSREDARKERCEYNGADFVWDKGNSPCRWHPSIHMPKEAARIWLKVTDVRVERLQDITIEGIRAEGLTCRKAFYSVHNLPESCKLNMSVAEHAHVQIKCRSTLTSMAVHAGDMEIAIQEWKILWDSTIKKADLPLYGWYANPWVWVIEFERYKKPCE